MGFAVCNGAICQCTFGTVPCTLVVTSNQKTLAGGIPMATIKDYQIPNLSTFGMCQSLMNPTVAAATSAAMGVLTPQPCTPKVSTTSTFRALRASLTPTARQRLSSLFRLTLTTTWL